jgi:hypothetical protein
MHPLDFRALFAFCDLHASRMVAPRTGMFFVPDVGLLYYDRQGFPIPAVDGVEPTLVWARLHADTAYRRVALDELPDGSVLSTVWLGLDHGFGGPPLIFETMRFSPASPDRLEFPDPFGEPGETIDQLRYPTEEDALASHHEIVRRIRVHEGH